MFKLPSVKYINPLILLLHNNPAEYEARLIKAKYKLPEIFDGVADQYIDPSDSVLDLGCGTGTVAKILRPHGHSAKRIANDISEPMIEYVLSKKLYDEGFCGSSLDLIDKMRIEKQAIDWAVSLSVLYYFSPEEMERLLRSLLEICKRGIIVSLDGIPLQFVDYLEATLRKRLELYDHRGYFDTHKLPTGWSSKVVYSGFGWQSSKTGIEIPAVLVVLTRTT